MRARSRRFQTFMAAGGPPPGGDPLWTNVRFMSNFEGTPGANNFVDSSTLAQTIAVFGGAQFSNAQADTGFTTSLDVTANGALIAAPQSADYSGPFTRSWCWEGRLYFPSASLGATRGFMGNGVGSGLYSYNLRITSIGKAELYSFDNASSLAAGPVDSAVLPLDQWFDFAYLYDATANKFYLMVNGVAVANATNASAGPQTFYEDGGGTSGDAMAIGGFSPVFSSSTSPGSSMHGYIQRIRYTQGDPRYAGGGTYTPIVGPYPNH